MKKSVHRHGIAFLLLALMAMTGVCESSDYRVLNPHQLAAMLSSPDTVVIDARADADWAATEGKIQGARRGPPGMVDFWADKYSKDDAIVLYCASPDEATSIKVARRLIAAGFTDVSVLDGGWNAWLAAGYPTVRK